MSSRWWTDEELLGMVRAAAAERGQPLRRLTYQAWARGHDDRANAEAIVRHLGHWTSVLEQAGLEVDRRYKVWR